MKKVKYSLWVPLISFLILLIVVFLSFFFIHYEKKLYEERTLKLCEFVGSSISSLSLEAITQEEKAYLYDYIKKLANNLQLGLRGINVYHIEDNKVYVYVSLEIKDFGKIVSKELANNLRGIKEYKLLETSTFYRLYFPILWNIKGKTFRIGVVEVIFSKKELLKPYYHSRGFLIFVIAITLGTISFLILLYIRLSRKLEEKMEEVRLLSITDELTKIYNRKKLNESLLQEINRSKRYKNKLSLIMFDIDHFKRVNDTYGHDVGDSVLVNITKVVSSNLRITDVFGRWGGEEFIIICPDTGITEARKLAERIRIKVEEFSFPVVKNLTCSLGVTELLPDDNVESLLKRVDEALYESKETGRNRVVVK